MVGVEGQHQQHQQQQQQQQVCIFRQMQCDNNNMMLGGEALWRGSTIPLQISADSDTAATSLTPTLMHHYSSMLHACDPL
jgi:hypothetical protein